MDFSLKTNEALNSYFLVGSDSFVPIPQLRYLHTHPFIPNNFLNEIDQAVQRSLELPLSAEQKHELGEFLVKEMQICLAVASKIEAENKAAHDYLESMRRILQKVISLGVTV